MQEGRKVKERGNSRGEEERKGKCRREKGRKRIMQKRKIAKERILQKRKSE